VGIFPTGWWVESIGIDDRPGIFDARKCTALAAPFGARQRRADRETRTIAQGTGGNGPISGVDVSIIIATRNRAASLSRTLEALSHLDLRGVSWEVLVIDNGSNDETEKVVAAAAVGLPIVALSVPGAGKNRALNRGVEVACGSLLVFTDDDVVPSSTWIQSLVGAAARWPEDNVFGGPVRVRFPPGTPEWLRRPDFPHARWALSAYNPRTDEGPVSDTPLGPNVAIRASALGDAPFDESIGPAGTEYAMGSEVELLLRLYRRGEQFIFVPDAPVEHVLSPEHTTKANLVRRARRCGRGNARLFWTLSTVPLFGIPAYHVQTWIKSALRLAVSPLRGEEERWIAAMEFSQARGHVGELIRLRRERSHPAYRRQRLFPRPSDVQSAILRRGFRRMATGALAVLVSPIVGVRTWRLFEVELDCPEPGSAPPPDVRIVLLHGSTHSRTVRVALCPLEVIGPEEIDRRLGRGDSVAIAYAGDRVIGYNWCGFSDHFVSETGLTLKVESTEVVGYDGFVGRDWRGRGVLPALDRAQMGFALELGRTWQLVYADGSNRASIKSLKRMGKTQIQAMILVTVPLLGRTYRLTRRRDRSARTRTADRGAT
jgi:glycosyltransferase involved in cell wall biosynthesis